MLQEGLKKKVKKSNKRLQFQMRINISRTKEGSGGFWDAGRDVQCGKVLDSKFKRK